MDFSLNEEQEMLKRSARDFLASECPESVVRQVLRSKEGYSPELWKKIAKLGWMGIAFPEQYGGTGGNVIDVAVLFEEMGRALFCGPYLSTVVLGGHTILEAGSQKQKTELLPKIVNGEILLSMALTEPESSWDGKAWEPEGVTLTASPDGKDFVLNGTKLFVHDAHIANYILCVARTRKGKTPEDGITLFLVDAKSKGLSYSMLKTMSSDNKQSEVVFNKVKVSKDSIVGELHQGWAPLNKSMQIGAVLLCAEMVGAGQRALEMAVDYAKTRIQFDMPIGINQYVQEHCVYLLGEVDACRWVTYLAAWRLSEGLPSDLEVAIAKGWTSDSHERACWRAHQVFAGVGSTEALGIMPLITRWGNTLQLYLGDARYHKKKIVEQLKTLPNPGSPKGKPRGLWDIQKEQIPKWDVWKQYFVNR